MLSLHTFVFGIFSYLGRPVSFKVPAATMEDTNKEGGPEGQAEKSQDSGDRCYDWLINVALLSNGINIVSVFLMIYLFLYLIVCSTSYFTFSIAVLPHSPGVVYYHLLLR